MLKDVRLNDRIVDPSSHSFLHANISLCEEKRREEEKTTQLSEKRKRRMD
jgi:hypothetical protein